ncbi:RNA metabolism-related protein [Prochlorococcus sp. MIT 0602]|nr:RNA metabolism-related protein [Prochlorococcus sp. MIT 0602]KGG16080.1 RNA metabolism-related protein [Prochlorococcus sp. MIT 0603]
MYPPVHRLLGWASRPSKISLKRSVWRLDQIKSIRHEEVIVKGDPADSDQATINRFPTLLEASLLNKNGEKIANIADLIFDTKTGNILYYLVSRTNPKIPGTSRWRFDLDCILDQEPGCVTSSIYNLEDLPLVKSSLRQDFLKQSKKIRENFVEISNLANEKLEGWLDEPLVDNSQRTITDDFSDSDIDDNYFDQKEYNRTDIYNDNEEDPWI